MPLTMKFWHCWNSDIVEILSTIIPSVWETLPLVVLQILSTESTISQPLSLAAPLLSYRNKLRHLPYMEYAIQHTWITVKWHKVTHFPIFKPNILQDLVVLWCHALVFSCIFTLSTFHDQFTSVCAVRKITRA